MEITTRDGKKLNYYVHGSGQPIVFLHGFGGYQQIWSDQIDFFVDKGYQVITYDQRNHGASSRESSLDDFGILITDLKDFLDGLKLDDPILVGHSMGASVIYGFISKYPDYPVKKLVTVDQSPKMLNTPAWKYGYMEITRANYKMRLKMHNKETLNGIDDNVFWKLNVVKKQFPFVKDDNLELLYDHARKDWRESVINCQVPMLLVTANQSPYFDGEFAELLMEKNSNLSHVAIDQSGHVIMAEQPDKFNQTLLNYIE